MVLDLGLEGMDGLDVAKEIRARGWGLAILILSARSAVGERVEGLDAGADDYMVKPFDVKELLARMRALGRRGRANGESSTLELADLKLSIDSHEVSRGSRRIDLTRIEFTLLELLLREQNKVLSREKILESVWGYDFATETNSLAVYIGYLRRKIEEGGEVRLIHTMRGVGYVAREP
jgi:two-component system response regulator MprA